MGTWCPGGTASACAADFWSQVGESNIVATHVVVYEQFDVGVQKIMTYYGLLILYRG